MGSKKKSNATTQTSTPPAYLEPWLKQAAGDAGNLYNQYKNVPNFYPGQTYVDFSPETEEALGMATEQARNGKIAPAAQSYLTDTLSGKYLNPQSNPYLAQIHEQNANQLRNQTSSQAALGGGLNSGAYRNATANALANSYANLYGGAYQQERGLMNEAAGMAPAINELQYADANELARVGQAREGLEEAKLQDSMDRWMEERNRPFAALDVFQGQLRGNPGINFGTTRSSTPYYENRTAKYGGAALTALSGNPLGGLLGAFA